MNYNDILRRFRYAVDLSDAAVIEIFQLVDQPITPKQLSSYLQREGAAGYAELSGEEMMNFLDGLIIFTRGRREGATAPSVTNKTQLTNNLILKKMRIALELREENMLDLFAVAEFKISKSELSALFRNKNHKNYKECGDQILRNFLNGLTVHNRSGDKA